MNLYSHLKQELLSGKKPNNLVSRQENKRKRPDSLLQARQLNHSKEVTSLSLGRKGKPRRSYSRKKRSIESYDDSQMAALVTADEERLQQSSEEELNNDISGYEESGEEEYGLVQCDSGDCSEVERPNKKLRGNSSVNQHEFYSSLDINDSARWKKAPRENSIHFIAKGGKSGKLPSCRVCGKTIDRDECRVAWFLRYNQYLPSTQEFMTRRISAYYLCAKVDCIMGTFLLGMEEITYNGEPLECDDELEEEKLKTYHQLLEELEI